MQFRIEPPPSVESPLSGIDPRWKLAAFLLMMVGVALLQTLLGTVLALALSLILLLSARVPWRWFQGRLLAMLLLLALFVLPIVLLSWHEPLDALARAGQMSGKALTLFVLGTILLISAPLEVTLKAARSLGAPGVLVQMMLLTYRYLFVLAEELSRLRIALRVRGFRNRASWHGYRTVGAAAGTLLVRGQERAGRVAQAMRCRGFDGTFRTLTTFRTTWRDMVTFVLLTAAMVAVCWVDGLGWRQS